MRDLVQCLTALSPTWLGAVAAAAAAGATLVPSRRILAGALTGGAVLALGLYRARPEGCADCAAAASGPVPDDDDPPAPKLASWRELFEGAGPLGAAGESLTTSHGRVCGGCA